MKVIWTNRASKELENTLDYWEKRTFSKEYSNKIRLATKQLQTEIEENPYFLARYKKKLDLYQRIYFKGKFSIFYDVVKERDLVVIYRFRSNRQKPL